MLFKKEVPKFETTLAPVFDAPLSFCLCQTLTSKQVHRHKRVKGEGRVKSQRLLTKGWKRKINGNLLKLAKQKLKVRKKAESSVRH